MPPAQGSAWNASYLRLCAQDTALFARHYGTTALGHSLLATLLTPVMAGLADATGRRHIAVLGRSGWVLFWVALRANWMTLRGRLLLEWLCWGVIDSGVWSAFSAQHSDLFGTRPELSSRIKAADQVWVNLAGFLGPIVGIWLEHASWGGERLVFYLAGAITVAMMAIGLTIPETLAPEKRKPFEIRSSNPLGNMLILFRNGRGLRGLGITTGLWMLVNTTCALPFLAASWQTLSRQSVCLTV